MKPLTVIIITHNRLEFTARTFNSLKESVPHARFLIGVDGNSEELVNYAIKEIGAENVFVSVKNHGWGSMSNMGLRYAETEMILISNNDVEYHPGWYERALSLYDKYPKIGVLGVWKHTAHGVKEELEDLIIKDQMPAVGWLFKRDVLTDIGPFAEHGPCSTKGGNGEDVDYCIRAEQKGYWVCGPKVDIAEHLDGY